HCFQASGTVSKNYVWSCLYQLRRVFRHAFEVVASPPSVNQHIATNSPSKLPQPILKLSENRSSAHVIGQQEQRANAPHAISGLANASSKRDGCTADKHDEPPTIHNSSAILRLT